MLTGMIFGVQHCEQIHLSEQNAEFLHHSVSNLFQVDI